MLCIKTIRMFKWNLFFFISKYSTMCQILIKPNLSSFNFTFGFLILIFQKLTDIMLLSLVSPTQLSKGSLFWGRNRHLPLPCMGSVWARVADYGSFICSSVQADIWAGSILSAILESSDDLLFGPHSLLVVTGEGGKRMSLLSSTKRKFMRWHLATGTPVLSYVVKWELLKQTGRIRLYPQSRPANSLQYWATHTLI